MLERNHEGKNGLTKRELYTAHVSRCSRARHSLGRHTLHHTASKCNHVKSLIAVTPKNIYSPAAKMRRTSVKRPTRR